MSRERKNYTPEEKVAILKRRLVDKAPASDLCDELGLHPTVFYGWQKQFFENGAAAFQKTRGRQADRRDPPLGSAPRRRYFSRWGQASWQKPRGRFRGDDRSGKWNGTAALS